MEQSPAVWVTRTQKYQSGNKWTAHQLPQAPLSKTDARSDKFKACESIF